MYNHWTTYGRLNNSITTLKIKQIYLIDKIHRRIYNTIKIKCIYLILIKIERKITMNAESKIYITASELAESLGISIGKAYAIIRQLNSELAKELSGKCPRRYLERKWYGYGVENQQ